MVRQLRALREWLGPHSVPRYVSLTLTVVGLLTMAIVPRLLDQSADQLRLALTVAGGVAVTVGITVELHVRYENTEDQRLAEIGIRSTAVAFGVTMLAAVTLLFVHRNTDASPSGPAMLDGLLLVGFGSFLVANLWYRRQL